MSQGTNTAGDCLGGVELRIAGRGIPRPGARERADQREQRHRAVLTFAVEQAWRTLEHNDRAIDRADAKAAAVLAADGAIGVTLFGLADSQTRLGGYAVATLALSAVFAITAAILTGLTLWPRRFRDTTPKTLVYHGDIARMTDSSVDRYVTQSSLLFVDPEELRRQLASQIWATGRVAAIKYMWVNLALASLLCSLAATSMAALFIEA